MQQLKIEKLQTIMRRLDVLRHQKFVSQNMMNDIYIQKIMKPFVQIQNDSREIKGFVLRHDQSVEENNMNLSRFFYHCVIQSEDYDPMEHILFMKSIESITYQCCPFLPCLKCSFAKNYVFHYTNTLRCCPQYFNYFDQNLRRDLKIFLLWNLWENDNNFINWFHEEVLADIIEMMKLQWHWC